jgi:hypothetical protein
VVWSDKPGEYEGVYRHKIRATRPVIVFCGYEAFAILCAWTNNKVAKIWLLDCERALCVGSIQGREQMSPGAFRGLRAGEMDETAEGIVILAALLGVLGGAYALAWRGKSAAVRRGASWVVAVICVVAGLWGMLAFAIPLLLDGLHNPAMSRWAVVTSAFVVAAICAVPLMIAARIATSALRRGGS